MLNIINNSLTIQKLKSEVKNKIESNNENTSIIEVIANDITILKGDTFNILEDVYLKGIDGEKIESNITYTSTPTFDINKEGSYLIEYETTYLNKTYTKSRIIEVIDTPYYALKLIKEIDELNDTKTELQASINNLTNKENDNNIFLQTYPIGSIYISTSSTNPGTIYGGTWELLSKKVIDTGWQDYSWINETYIGTTQSSYTQNKWRVINNILYVQIGAGAVEKIDTSSEPNIAYIPIINNSSYANDNTLIWVGAVGQYGVTAGFGVKQNDDSLRIRIKPHTSSTGTTAAWYATHFTIPLDENFEFTVGTYDYEYKWKRVS